MSGRCCTCGGVGCDCDAEWPPYPAAFPLDTSDAPHLANDERFDGWLRDRHAEFFRCPVIACHMGPDANVYTATLRGPDGRQRTVWGCVRHLDVRVQGALSAIQLEPFE